MPLPTFTEAKIKEIFVHRVGNKSADEHYFISKNPIDLTDDLSMLFGKYFLSAFKSEETFCLSHDVDIALNVVYDCVSKVFANPDALAAVSENLAVHLYGQSTHPKIKGGEFYVAYFKNCLFDNHIVDAIGLFKSENKDQFLAIEQNLDAFEVAGLEGININKLDKGCLIFNTEAEAGYLVQIVDNTNKGSEAQYWRDDFLSAKVLNNDYHQTNQFLGIAKKFVTEQLGDAFEVNKTDKIDLLNRSVDYFKNNETFDKAEFEETVFHHDNIIDSFREFDQNYRKEHDLELSDSFDISTQAVKKQARIFKSVLKLDKNFHIYIHGNTELIEQGTDENGRKFYKIFYESEA